MTKPKTTIAPATAAIKCQYRLAKRLDGTFHFHPLPPGSPRSVITIEEVAEILSLDLRTIAALKSLNYLPSRVHLDGLTACFKVPPANTTAAKTGKDKR
jgi:hypothetical protein